MPDTEALPERARIVAQGVTVNPNVMGGEPCLAGTRMPTRAIRSLARAGYGVDSIRSQYPTVTPWQIADALAWEFRTVKDRRMATDYIAISRLSLGDQKGVG